MRTKSTCLAILAVLVAPLAAHADVIYENPWNSAAADSGAFSQANQQLAGQFILGANATVDRATWYGTMFSADPLDTGDTWDFDLIFYADTGGLPGSVVSTASVVASVFDTGIDNPTERSYLFDASFSGVDLLGGVSYWFSALNTGDQNTFRWTEATAGLGTAISNNGLLWGELAEVLRTPVNFSLHQEVSEPGTLALFGIGLLGMGAARRRKKT